jgi:epoxyqueuosine reductase QueG
LFSFLSIFFEKEQIDCYAALPLEACRVVKPYLLEREGIQSGTVVMLAVPYYSRAASDASRNISAYAVARDYHSYFKDLFARLLPQLKALYPQNKFAAFADHSPIAEGLAAATAGLGILGKNHLLITPKYSSYVFLGELVTDLSLPFQLYPVTECEACGACMKACPAEECGICLSALTQKKGTLTEEEEKLIVKYGSAWGCDICQAVCPHTKQAIASGSIYSPIPFFAEQTIPHLTSNRLLEMSDDEFLSRAYSWRGKSAVLRNLLLLEETDKGDYKC